MERVVLVDESDREVGTEDKLQAHRQPRLHRAVSVFVCNSQGQMLVQLRSLLKYHSAALWSNACCGHPRLGELPQTAARRRLLEEMGLECQLHRTGVLIYRLDVGDGLSEHELNHVFIGECDGVPQPDPQEVSDWQWLDSRALHHLRRASPSPLTPWFNVVLDDLVQWVSTRDALLPEPIAAAARAWDRRQ